MTGRAKAGRRAASLGTNPRPTQPHGQLSVECQQARRRSVVHDLAEGDAVGFGRLAAISGADAPIHAPAIVTCAARAEEVFESGPQIRREWMNFEFHAFFACYGMGRSWMIIHDVPNLSLSIPKRKAKNVSAMGMRIWPPSASSA